jgi:acyl carrier protein
MSREQEFRNLLAEKFLPADYVARLQPDDDLFELLDSVQVLRLVAALEKTYGISVEDADIGSLATLRQATDFLTRKGKTSA